MLSFLKGRSMAKARVLIPTDEEALRHGVPSLVPDLAIGWFVLPQNGEWRGRRNRRGP